MHVISSYRGNRHRLPARCIHQSYRQDRLQHTAPLSLARSVSTDIQINSWCIGTRNELLSRELLSLVDGTVLSCRAVLKYGGSGSIRSSHQSVSGESKKIVSPSIFKGLLSYFTCETCTVIQRPSFEWKCDILGGSKLKTYPSNIFSWGIIRCSLWRLQTV